MIRVTAEVDPPFHYAATYWEGRTVDVADSVQVIIIDIWPDRLVFDTNAKPTPKVIRAVISILRGEQDGKRSG
jgi:hypothetical protein